MQPQKFRDLYVQKNNDLKVTTFEGVAGFSVVRNYPENTKFFKDGNLMFIRIFLKEKYVCGGIEMVSGGGHKDDRYYLIDASFYKNKITGFSFNEDENIIFDSTTSRMHNGKSKKQLSLNEFIDILVKNHLQDKLFFKRKINFIVHLFLRFIFWLVNQKYDDIKIFYNNTNPQIQNQNINKRSSEPFFKYFSISKNILFLLSILITFLLFFLGNLTKSVYFMVL